MESTLVTNTLRTNVCIIFSGLNKTENSDEPWPDGADELIRKLYKKGLNFVIIGPKPLQKFGSKDRFIVFDRHDVVSLKTLARAKRQNVEIRLLGKKLKAWTRIRSDVCVVSSPYGLWPQSFPGWSLPGVFSLDTLTRFVKEFKFVPGSRFVFYGSHNRNLNWASHLLDIGAQSCAIIEPSHELKCWRAHRDRFLAKGGRIFLDHSVQRVEEKTFGSLAIHLKNVEIDGTMVLETDSFILSAINRENLNSQSHWQKGLYYIQRSYSTLDPVLDEAHESVPLDWSELSFRIMKQLKIGDHAEITGQIEHLKEIKKELFSYRKNRIELSYNGKNLSKDCISQLKATGSVPKTFETPKPMASLECFEKIPCTTCVTSCPYEAIAKPDLVSFPQILSDKCIGCGACVASCPSSAIVMIRETPQASTTKYFLPDSSSEIWKEGEGVNITNRRGDILGLGRVVASTTFRNGLQKVVEIEAPSYQLWDARFFKKQKKGIQSSTEPMLTQDQKGWITLNGVKRLAPLEIPITIALWKLGYKRFEDSLFCKDGGCRLCEVTLNGKKVLACKENLTADAQLEFVQNKDKKHFDCFCSKSDFSEVLNLQKEGNSFEVAQEAACFGQGKCKGRWCLNRDLFSDSEEKKGRPDFPGFDISPWFEVGIEDIYNGK